MKKFDKPVIVAISLALLITTNLLVSIFSIKIDFSRDKAYTLSPSTKKILRSLNDVVNMKFYVSSNLPSRLLPLKTEVIDLLNEYKKESNNKVIIKVVDPKKDESTLDEIKSLQIPELQFSQLEKDKYQLATAYFAMGLFFGEKSEALPQVTDLTSLEYNITSNIYRLTQKELGKVATIGMDNISANPQEDPYGFFKGILSQQYEITPLNLATETESYIDNSYKTVILTNANKEQYTTDEVEKIKKYIKKGGNMIFFVDGVWVKDDLTTEDAGHNLFSLFNEWGVTLQKNLILSTSAEYVNFGNNLYQFLTPYPFWVKTNNFNLNQYNEYTGNVRQTTYPWTSSITLNKKNNKNIQTLVLSSNTSWEQKDTFKLLPQQIEEPNASKTSDNGHVLLIPSSRFLDGRYLSKDTGNIDFIFNIVNNYASEGALSGIRSRSFNFYPLPDMSDSQKEMMRYLNIFFLPLVVFLYGGIRLMRRR